MKNIDSKTVKSFAEEWQRFDQSGMNEEEAAKVFHDYFSVFPWSTLPKNAEGFDMGCGSGRWARLAAPRVGKLHCIDPSDAIKVARKSLADYSNVSFHQVSVNAGCLPNDSQDFGYSLGVLHHVPDTVAAIKSCVSVLKPGAPLLLYLYYAFDNRPLWFKALWRCSNFIRGFISRLPDGMKHVFTDPIAVMVYWPLARVCILLEKMGLEVSGLPLAYYRHHSLYTMRTDARDRFGTPLEHRFTKRKISDMMDEAGLSGLRFSEKAPFWCVVGFKRVD